MKLINKKMFLLALVIIMVLSIAACGSNNNSEDGGTGQPSDEDETVEITYLSMVTPNLDDEFWDSVVQRFEDDYPHIKVNRIQAPAMEGSNDNYGKTLLASGDFPDVISNISVKDFVDADALLEIPVDEDVKKIRDYEALMLDGKLYHLQAYIQPETLVFYNKEMFAKAGIESTPKSLDELMDAADKLDQAGFTPFLTAGEWVTQQAFKVISTATVFGDNPNWWTDRYAGEVDFTDEDWRKPAEFWQEAAKKGYFNEGALGIGFDQLEQEFLQGKGAMHMTGSWFSASEAASDHDFEVGVFAGPTVDGSGPYVGGARGLVQAVSRTTEHPEESLLFAKYVLIDPEIHREFNERDAKISGLVEPINYEFTPLQQEIFDLYQDSTFITNPPQPDSDGTYPVPGITGQLATVAQNLIIGDADIEEQLESLNKYWEENKTQK